MDGFDRRQLLRYSALGMAGALTGRFGKASAMRLPVNPAPGNAPQEILFVLFVRGGIDMVSTIVPVGDSTYQAQRDNGDPTTTLYYTNSDTSPLLGNSYARLHNRWSRLASVDAANDAAWVGRVADIEAMRSHFQGFDDWERLTSKSTVIDPTDTEGWVPRFQERILLNRPLTTVRHANIAIRNQRAFQTTNPDVLGMHARNFPRYNLAGGDEINGTPLLEATDPFTANVRADLTAHLMQSQSTATEQHVDAAGDYVLATEALIPNYTPDGTHFPITATDIAAAGLPALFFGPLFMQSCEEALQLALLPNADAPNVIGLEMGGFDTHQNQRATRDSLDPWLAHAIWGLYERTKNLTTKRVHILMVSEFGRTNAINSSDGTDHGVGSCIGMFGPDVNPGVRRGGVYNCHGGQGKGAQWKELGSPESDPLFKNAVEPVRDFRAIFAEYLFKRFRLNQADIDHIIPQWSTLVASGDPMYQFQNYIKPV